MFDIVPIVLVFLFLFSFINSFAMSLPHVNHVIPTSFTNICPFNSSAPPPSFVFLLFAPFSQNQFPFIRPSPSPSTCRFSTYECLNTVGEFGFQNATNAPVPPKHGFFSLFQADLRCIGHLPKRSPLCDHDGLSQVCKLS